MINQSKANNEQDALISIIVPFFNREKYLAESVESVLKQTYQNWELLLINDGSTDKSVEIAKSYVEKYPTKILLFSHENNENKGASATRNLGIKKSVGNFITFLDSDDVYFADTFARELEAFEKCPQADAVCGTAECWYSWAKDKNDREKDFVIDLVLKTEKLYEPPELQIHNLKAGGRKAHTNCMLLKREFIDRIGAFEEDYRHIGEDQVFWAKLTLNGKIFVMDAVLAKYRLHSESICATEMADGEDIPLMHIYLDWLESYLQTQKIEDKRVMDALKGYRRMLKVETKLKKLKEQYRYIFPLHFRYKMRDRLTKLKQILSRSSHR